MDSNGIRILVDLLTLAHLHTSRATVPLQVYVAFVSYYSYIFKNCLLSKAMSLHFLWKRNSCTEANPININF